MKVMRWIGKVLQFAQVQLHELAGDEAFVAAVGLLVQRGGGLYSCKESDAEGAGCFFQQAAGPKADLQNVLIGLQVQPVDDPAVEVAAGEGPAPVCAVGVEAGRAVGSVV